MARALTAAFTETVVEEAALARQEASGRQVVNGPEPAPGEIAVHETSDGEVRVEVWLERDKLWLSLAQMAELSGRDKSV